MTFCVVWFSNLLHTIVRWSCRCNNVGQKPLHDFGNVVFGRKALKGQHQLSWKPLRKSSWWQMDTNWALHGHPRREFFTRYECTYAVIMIGRYVEPQWIIGSSDMHGIDFAQVWGSKWKSMKEYYPSIFVGTAMMPHVWLSFEDKMTLQAIGHTFQVSAKWTLRLDLMDFQYTLEHRFPFQ